MMCVHVYTEEYHAGRKRAKLHRLSGRAAILTPSLSWPGPMGEAFGTSMWYKGRHGAFTQQLFRPPSAPPGAVALGEAGLSESRAPARDLAYFVDNVSLPLRLGKLRRPADSLIHDAGLREGLGLFATLLASVLQAASIHYWYLRPLVLAP